MPILGYFDIVDILCPFLLILNQKKNLKIKTKKNWKFEKFEKLAPKMLILACFGPKNNCMVKMTTPYTVGHLFGTKSPFEVQTNIFQYK